jgi:hypothetical protein
MESRHQEKIWKFLHDKVEDVEEKIKEAAIEIKRELHKDLRDAKGTI